MPLVSISQIAASLSLPHQSVNRALSGMPHEPGPRGAKLFRSEKAIPLVCQALGLGGEKPGEESYRDRRERAAARREEIEVEILEGKWLPYADAEEGCALLFQAAVSGLKAKRRKLGVEIVNEVIGMLRALPSVAAKARESSHAETLAKGRGRRPVPGGNAKGAKRT